MARDGLMGTQARQSRLSCTEVMAVCGELTEKLESRAGKNMGKPYALYLQLELFAVRMQSRWFHICNP